MTNLKVTIIVSPRERFSFARESLESIYTHTDFPFKLIYVDGNSPTNVQRYLESEASAKGFELIRTESYLSPNQARNMGLQKADTEYVVFIDNDVIVTPGWLTSLVKCADETQATVVSPLICQGTPVHTEVHCAGGEARVLRENKDGKTRHRIQEKIYKQGRQVSDIYDQLQREPTGLAEFHCMMVRRSFLDQLGALDEKILNTREHVDFCITVSEAGGTIYLEPTSIVTYVPGPPLTWSDLPFFMLRWSDAWEMTSLKRLLEKWELTEDDFFKHRYRRLGWRRHETIVRPLIARIGFAKKQPRIERTLISLDRKLNRYLTNRHDRQQCKNL
jgi:GT2 family glycosyltransferase